MFTETVDEIVEHKDEETHQQESHQIGNDAVGIEHMFQSGTLCRYRQWCQQKESEKGQSMALYSHTFRFSFGFLPTKIGKNIALTKF